MRTTITIDEALYRRAKAKAAQTGRSVSEVIEDSVREALRPGRRRDEEPPALETFGSGGVLPGIDLLDNAATREAMDDAVGLDALR